jgi:enamine deaminase RidA (YjgF/YER057c/UK114 family)
MAVYPPGDSTKEVTTMPRRLISSGSPFEKTIGFSRAMVDGPWCFVSGTVGFDSDGKIPDDVEMQTRNALAIIGRALASAGFTFRDVVRVHYIVADRRHVPLVTPLFGEIFGDIRPAATLIIAGLIDERMKVEVEVTAYRPE